MDEKKYFIKESTLEGMGDAMREALGVESKIPVADFERVIRLLGDSISTPDPYVLMTEQVVPFVAIPDMGVWLWNCSDGSIQFELIEGEVYTVVWNKQEYACTAKAAQFSGTNGIGIGNFGAVGLGDNTGEPFLLGVADADMSIACYAFEEPIDGNCTIGVYDIGIAGGTAGGGGAMPDDVHTVTFMDETGENVLYTRSVADGDDCADPVERLLMDEPTKESSAQYVYDHNGWATVAGGSADSSALTAVTEDKTVYAAFSSSLRYYTISYFDDDGTTLLKTENLAYGSMPSYTPEKSGASFEGWMPVLAAVTGDATYTAVWAEKITFAGGSWEDIIAIAESGQAKEYFAVGDMKTVTIGDTEMNLYIIGFDHDDLADGSGRASMTIASNSPLPDTMSVESWATVANNMRTILKPQLPSVLQAAIKPVLKECDETTAYNAIIEPTTIEFDLFPLSLKELGVRRHWGRWDTDADWEKGFASLGRTYAYFSQKYNSTYGRPLSDGIYSYKSSKEQSLNGGAWFRQLTRFSSLQGTYVQFGGSSQQGGYYASATAARTSQRKVTLAFCI